MEGQYKWIDGKGLRSPLYIPIPEGLRQSSHKTVRSGICVFMLVMVVCFAVRLAT